jgi:NAD(P)-dependent dehydrogenase (short-subunit alcohol dehydrogenase family)
VETQVPYSRVNLTGSLIPLALGIGKYTAISLARRGCKVVIACRDATRAHEAMKEINSIVNSSSPLIYPYHKKGAVEYLSLDLGNPPSIDEFSRQFRASYSHLDFLINNGGLNTKGTLSFGGKKIEQLFGVNYLGHYYLFRRLQDLLQTPNPSINQNTPSRVVNLSSVTHHQGSSDFISSCYFCLSKASYRGCSPYADSKLYMNYLTLEINKRFSGSLLTVREPSAAHSGTRTIVSLSVNPGAVKSDIWRSVPFLLRIPYDAFMTLFYLTTEQGCHTSLTACILPLPDIVHHTSQHHPSADNISDTLLTHHPLIPYLIPYTMHWRCLAFEMINAFSGSGWGYVSLPSNSDKVSSDLWDFSCDVINSSSLKIPPLCPS